MEGEEHDSVDDAKAAMELYKFDREAWEGMLALKTKNQRKKKAKKKRRKKALRPNEVQTKAAGRTRIHRGEHPLKRVERERLKPFFILF